MTTDYNSLVSLQRQYHESGEPSTLKSRKLALQTLKTMLTKESDKLTAAVEKDLRRQPGVTYTLEIGNVLVEIDYFLDNLEEWMSPIYVEKTLTTALDTPMIVKQSKGVVLLIGPWNYPINTPMIVKQSKGVVLLIGPWNYPISMILLPLVGILGAGNTVVIKPSEVASNTAQVFDELFTKYYEKRFLAVVQGGIPETTALLQERFDHIMYTGCTPVGKIIMTAASKHLTPITLELGGKCPVIIEDDTIDMKITTKRIAWGKWLNCGQTCLAPDYILTTPQLKGHVINGLIDAIKEFYGNDIQKSKDYSRIINQRHFDRIHSLYEKTKGKIVFNGGEFDRDDCFIPPIILDVEQNDIFMHDEIFGPILPILTIRDLDDGISFIKSDDGISFIKSGERPLAAYIFTKNEKIIEKFLLETISGGVTINDVLMHVTVDTLPFGGIGYSGIGNYRGKYGFDTFSHQKSVLKRGFFGESLASARYPPMTTNKIEQMKKLTGIRRSIPKFIKNYFPTLPILFMGILIGFLMNKYTSNLH
uniref:Aldehyde dehydrogenase n=1 Tax=Panagrolaimus sp. JU765 TaxID=591449 RepID=A0AC34R227_9BILA